MTQPLHFLVTRLYFSSRDKDGGHTIRSAVAKTPMLHEIFVALYVLYNWSYCRSKFYIAELNRSFLPFFASVTFTLAHDLYIRTSSVFPGYIPDA